MDTSWLSTTSKLLGEHLHNAVSLLSHIILTLLPPPCRPLDPFTAVFRYIEAIDVCNVVLNKYPSYNSIRRDVLDKARVKLRILGSVELAALRK